MKKLILLPVLLFLLMTSCREEDAPSPHDENAQLKGTWATFTQEYKHYDANGQLVHEEREEEKTLFNFDAGFVTTTYSTGTETKCFYGSFESNGRGYLQFYHNGRLQEFEIVSVTDSTMSWQVRSDNPASGAGSTTKEAGFVIVTFDLARQ